MKTPLGTIGIAIGVRTGGAAYANAPPAET